MAKCKLCGKIFGLITNTHLIKHNYTVSKYIHKFGIRGVGFKFPQFLSQNDPRYIRWRESLKKRPSPWNKGQTKETHPGVAKTSKTMKEKRIDNFAEWRKEMIKRGLIKKRYPSFKKSGDLAELVGVVLGDGHIGKFPRTENLAIFSNSNNQGFVNRYRKLIENVFDKKPMFFKIKNYNCIKINIYQKDISKRLNIPAGNKRNSEIKIPNWIWQNKNFLIRYLRGLYEAEGSFCIHKPTSTYKFLFGNRNKSLLRNVYRSLKVLGFHPHRDHYRVQISRREEVYRIKDLLKFRQY